MVDAVMFRKKPVVIEAVQFTGVEWEDDVPSAMFDGTFGPLPEWLTDAMAKRETTPGALWTVQGRCIAIRTLEGCMFADPGDWIIRGVAGELYPCKPEIFAQSYDLAEARAARIAALEAENARLKEALKPFAEAGHKVHEDHRDTFPLDLFTYGSGLTVGDLRRARAALNQRGEG